MTCTGISRPSGSVNEGERSVSLARLTSITIQNSTNAPGSSRSNAIRAGPRATQRVNRQRAESGRVP